MDMKMKDSRRPYSAPAVIGSAQVRLEKDMLFGSIVDWALPVETAGLENGGFFEYESTPSFESTFNHTWGE